MIDYNNIIDNWIGVGKIYKPYSEKIKSIFEVAFENTTIPESAYFGYPKSKSSINLMFQRIYLIGVFDKRIEIIVDSDISKEIKYEVRKIGISRTKELDLFWVSTGIENINDLIKNKKIWKHYKLATIKITNSSTLIGQRNDWLDGKYLLKDFYSKNYKLLENDFINSSFEKEIEKSINDERSKRLLRIEYANKKPKVTESIIKTYIRNADIVAETLYRANGICEYCQKNAPFVKDIDKKGYLEVHHIKPLSENGDDTLENTIALCPNCHRHAHYGKKTFDLKKRKKYST